MRAFWRYAARPAAAAGFILIGFIAPRLVPNWGPADVRKAVWLGGLVLLGAPIVIRTVAGLWKGKFAADVVASLALIAAVALQQPLAGLVVVLMQTGGEALERFAAGRASRAVRDLEADAPRIGHRLESGQWQDVLVDQIAIGDGILVRPGEMVPCDGVVRSGRSRLDTSPDYR